jgi:hypothetical protein
MRFLSTLVLAALTSVPSLFAQGTTPPYGEEPPFPASGRYVGVLTVTQKFPLVGFSGVPMDNRAHFVAVKSSARVTVHSSGSQFRIIGLPGSTLLSLLDEPNFASVKLVPHYSAAADFTGFTVDARKGSGVAQVNGNRVVLSFQLLVQHNDFAWADNEILDQTIARIDMTRTGP